MTKILSSVQDILPPPFQWCEIPAGRVTLKGGGYLDEPTTFDVPAFAIAKYPITNAQFHVFVDAKDGYANPKWWDYSEDAAASRKAKPHPKERGFPEDDHPRVNVSWYEAVAFCRWLTALMQPSPLAPLPQGEENKGSGEWDSEEKERYREMASQAMVGIARDLRQRQTGAESVLWECLRDRRLGEIKFRRQHPIARTSYVVDFLSYEKRLAIELDGEIHATQQAADAARQKEIEALGYRVLRFDNQEIFSDLEATLTTILQAAFSPLPQGEGQGVMAITLPTEQQWQRAAQGDDRRAYPWGSEFDQKLCNTEESGIKHITPVTQYPQRESPYHVMDMIGNVWEWCLTSWITGNLGANGTDVRCLRGGSWNVNQNVARASCRYWLFPNVRNSHFGFRVSLSFP